MIPLWLKLAIVVATLLIAWAIRTYHNSPARKWARIKRDVRHGIAARRVR